MVLQNTTPNTPAPATRITDNVSPAAGGLPQDIGRMIDASNARAAGHPPTGSQKQLYTAAEKRLRTQQLEWLKDPTKPKCQILESDFENGLIGTVATKTLNPLGLDRAVTRREIATEQARLKTAVDAEQALLDARTAELHDERHAERAAAEAQKVKVAEALNAPFEKVFPNG